MGGMSFLQNMNFTFTTHNYRLYYFAILPNMENTWLFKKYGRLNKEMWKEDLRQGFAECFSVLKPNGTLVFKWAESNIPLKEVLQCTEHQPLFGHKTKKGGTTIWCAFIK